VDTRGPHAKHRVTPAHTPETSRSSAHQLRNPGRTVRAGRREVQRVRDLIRRDQERERLRGLLLDGAASPPGAVADDSYLESLRNRVRAAD
jgi:hypothetical protein